MGCHFLLQRVIPTQGLNLRLLHCRQTLYHLSHQGSPKNIYFYFIDYTKAFDCVDIKITTNCGKFFKRWEYQTTLPTS